LGRADRHPLAGPALVLGAAAFVVGLEWAQIAALVAVLTVLAVAAANDVCASGARRARPCPHWRASPRTLPRTRASPHWATPTPATCLLAVASAGAAGRPVPASRALAALAIGQAIADELAAEDGRVGTLARRSTMASGPESSLCCQ
jgi:hypothetical protein